MKPSAQGSSDWGAWKRLGHHDWQLHQDHLERERGSTRNLEAGGGEVSWGCKAMAATLSSKELAQENFRLQIRMSVREC